jgi:hypothetical protein
VRSLLLLAAPLLRESREALALAPHLEPLEIAGFGRAPAGAASGACQIGP